MHLAIHAPIAILDVRLAGSYMVTNVHLVMYWENIPSWMEQLAFPNALLATMGIELKLNVNRAWTLVKVVETDLLIATLAISNIPRARNITRKENVRPGAIMGGLCRRVSMISHARNVATTVELVNSNLTIVSLAKLCTTRQIHSKEYISALLTTHATRNALLESQ